MIVAEMGDGWSDEPAITSWEEYDRLLDKYPAVAEEIAAWRAKIADVDKLVAAGLPAEVALTELLAPPNWGKPWEEVVAHLERRTAAC